MLLVEKNYNSGLRVDKYLFYKVHTKNPLDFNATYVLLFCIHVMFWCFTYGKKIPFNFLIRIAKINTNCLNQCTG